MDKISKGSKYYHSFQFTQEDVNLFAEISGDKNPLHIDPEFAKNSIFGKTIIHGFLGGSVFSKILAMEFPGSGTIYLRQNLKFLKPMFTNTKYTAYFEIIEHIKEKHRALLITNILEDDNLIIEGDALIQNNLSL